ncbi:MAG: methionine synthase [Acidobacteriota bacterium]|nr:methionine synthase [Acidobacteriota bacterium]MDH3785299.1 methionine synthase [Acidobacteriota bacterium]
MPTLAELRAALNKRILVYDGAMGTMIQSCDLGEDDFRGDEFADHSMELIGCNDLLCLTLPATIEKIHRDFLEAGADIISTNTFNAQSISLADYGLESHVVAINRAAAQIAKTAAEAYTTPERPRWVAGAIGPTNRTASLSPDVSNPALRNIDFDGLVDAYHEQVTGLVEGGVDILLPETTFDTLNLKAALFAIQRYFDENDCTLPVIASLTVTDRSGRTLSGQTVEAAWISISHVDMLAVGINCALGPEEMRPHLEELSRVAPTLLSCYPNAGLPNELGGYDETPQEMAAVVAEFARDGLVNLVGGCCGTTPEHIRAIGEAVACLAPRVPPAPVERTRLSGLEPLELRPDSNFTMIGERTNVTGSRRFARLIGDDDFGAALSVARQQVLGGANILDVNMDEGLLDSPAAMTTFLNLIATEPEIARIPIMIDSSDFRVLEAGLKCVQGKAVVNSISLKEGEDAFRQQARLVRRFGAAVVVMAFDEEGQAVDRDRKVEILTRSYRILTEEVGFPATDIIFDPNILTVATGIEEHDRYALEYIEAIAELKRRFPLARCSGGISNISFSFRGNDAVREAMHSAFLYHAINAGLDMGIVNAGQLTVYDDVPDELLERVEDVLLARRADATERLVETADSFRGVKKDPQLAEQWRALPLAERISHALIHGIDEHVDTDIAECLEQYPTPLSIIEGPLMDGMNIVGTLFGAGKMFLPQVVKSARVMKRAVNILEPLMDQQRVGDQQHRGTILLATVKGDVHDIGKNIVGVVLGCNNYRIVDLGVMVPAERILEEARSVKADIIGLSGLITPSLDQMVRVASQMTREGFETPLLIGGATTSSKHTAVKIAPAYAPGTIHVPDASKAVDVVGHLLSERRAQFVGDIEATQATARERFADGNRQALLDHPTAVERCERQDWDAYQPPQPQTHEKQVVASIALGELVPLIDWTPFFHVWELRGAFPRILKDPRYGETARDLHRQATERLEEIVKTEQLQARGVYGFFPAASEGDDIVLFDRHGGNETARIPTLRQQRDLGNDRPTLALADFVAPADSALTDWLGAFAVTAGHGLERLTKRHEDDHDDFASIMDKALADRLAEAAAEWLHAVARRAWGFGEDEQLTPEELIAEKYRGIRPAPGYPACPDHTDKATLWKLLDVEGVTDIQLTESFAMWPAASVSGFLYSHPRSRYFSVGPVGRDQIVSYAKRKGISVAEAERWLSPSLGYDP